MPKKVKKTEEPVGSPMVYTIKATSSRGTEELTGELISHTDTQVNIRYKKARSQKFINRIIPKQDIMGLSTEEGDVTVYFTLPTELFDTYTGSHVVVDLDGSITFTDENGAFVYLSSALHVEITAEEDVAKKPEKKVEKKETKKAKKEVVEDEEEEEEDDVEDDVEDDSEEDDDSDVEEDSDDSDDDDDSDEDDEDDEEDDDEDWD